MEDLARRRKKRKVRNEKRERIKPQATDEGDFFDCTGHSSWIQPIALWKFWSFTRVSVLILSLMWFRKCFFPNEQTQNQSCWHLPLLQQQLWVIFICQDENQIYLLQYPWEILPLHIRCALTIVSIVLGPGFKNDTSFSFQIQMQTADKTSYHKTKVPRTNKSTIKRLNSKPQMVNVITMTFPMR